MIKKIYAKLGTGMTLQPIRIEPTPRTYLLESQQLHTDSVPAVSPVAETHPELNVYCPTCDYHSATALMCDPDDPFYNVTCSQCGLDADREKVFLSPSGFQPHQAQ